MAQSGYGIDIGSYPAYLAYSIDNSWRLGEFNISSGSTISDPLEMALYDWQG